MSIRTTIDFGIHLGNCHSSIAVFNGGKPEVVKNNLDGDVTPSAVFIGKHGNIIIGAKAKSKLEDCRSSNDVYTGFVRQMHMGGGGIAYTFESSGLRKSPEELSAEVLKSLKGNVQQRMNEDVKAAVVTIPVAYSQRQCAATKHASELAGFVQCPLLQEPVAASLAYGFQSDSGKCPFWLVFDFGGDTFDVAVMKAEDRGIQVVNHGRDNFLGGADIDWAVVNKIIVPTITSSYNLPDFKLRNDRWRSAFVKIKRAVEFAKIDLSQMVVTNLDGCCFEDVDGNEVNLDGFELTRNQLTDIAEPLIVRAVEKCKSVLAEKNLSTSAIGKAILVGGPTLAPYFRDILADKLGIPLDHSVDPLTVYAQGAAIFAGTQRIDQSIHTGGVSLEALHTTGISRLEQFLACLKQQVPVSSQIKAANQLDVSSLTENEQKQIADALRTFAGTKNGPMLIMGLPGPLQALLSFAGAVMPGQDRLAYLRATPCQALIRLAHHDDRKLLESYPFEKASKADWSCYLSKATKLIEPCKKFLSRAESTGGFSNAELIALARRCPLVIPWIDPDNTPFIDAYRLYTENNADALWKKYPFSTLKKYEWLLILNNSKIDIPSVFSTAVNYGMFTVSELLDLAGHNQRIYPFIPLDEIDQISLVSHLLKNEATFLWQHYDFKRLNAHSWERLICERRATSIVPHAALLFSAKGLSNLIVGRILEHDDRYINYVPLSLVSKEKLISLLVTGKYDDLWNKCDFSEFEKADWWLLFSKTDKVPPAFKVAVEKKLFSLSELCDYARHNEGFVSYLPITDIDAKTLVDLLVCSKTDYLWTSANLKRLNADQWVELIKKRKPLIPGKFLQHLRNAKQLGTRHVTRILDVDYRYYTYVPLELIPCDRIVKYLLSGEAEDLWQTYPFDLFKDDDWFALLEQSDHPVPDAGMVFLANQFGAVSVDKLNLLLAKRRTLVGYMRPQDIDPKLAVGFLTQSSDSPLWKSYDFNRFSDSQIQTIVRKSTDRDSWPEAIVAKFSDGEGSFSDEIILSLAEGLSHTDGNITNVVELLSVSRIHQSGVHFFGRICKRIPQVKSASATVIRKLSLGGKPWQSLRREFLTCLLMDVPICRKFINWQDYELVTIDKLASANHVYEDELRAGRKFKLFVWRHWLELTIFLVVVSCIACVTAKALYDAAKERAIAERKNNITFRINELGRRSEFHQLQQYVDTVEKGEDADVLQKSNVANSLNRLSAWNAKRDSLDIALRRLESLSVSNWPDDSLEESNLIFAKLKKNDSVESDESALIKKFYSEYSSRVAEVERVKRNERLAAEIAKITDDCVECSSVESLIGMLVELTRISEVEDISEKNKSSCSEATALAKKRINDLYKEILTIQRRIIDQANVENVITDALGVLGSIQSGTYASEENIREADYLRDLANKKIAEIRAAEAARLAAEKEKREKQEVETISLKVTSLVSQLDAPCDSFDDNLFIKIREELDSLSECPSYDRFCKENPQEIPALSSRLEAYEKGIAKADELGRKCIDIEGDAASRMLGGKERELCDDLIRQLDSWIGDYASTIAWKIKSIESHKSKIANLLEESNTVKTLIDNANGATDYKTLCESINALLEKHSGFAECQEIDPAKILSEKQVMSVIEDSGFFSTKRLFEFAGLIKINPKSKGAIVPLLNNSVTNATFIYYVTRMSDSEDGKNGLKVKKIFERTANGVVGRVNGIDYSRCQGVGLFVSTDPTYVDQDSWIPGMTHPAYPHWMASSTYGEWVPEPGYGKTSSAGEGLGNLEWRPSKTYLKGKAKSGERPGEWRIVVDCSSCGGTGYSYYYDYYINRRRRGDICFYCNGKGYSWEDVGDPKMVEKLLVLIKNSLTKGGK